MKTVTGGAAGRTAMRGCKGGAWDSHADGVRMRKGAWTGMRRPGFWIPVDRKATNLTVWLSRRKVFESGGGTRESVVAGQKFVEKKNKFLEDSRSTNSWYHIVIVFLMSNMIVYIVYLYANMVIHNK